MTLTSIASVTLIVMCVVNERTVTKSHDPVEKQFNCHNVYYTQNVVHKIE